MAVTYETLITDIQKRMARLGYDDLEELAGPDHDIQSLKELKKRLMQEEKDLKSTKKELTKDTKAMRDFLVKVSRIMKDDFYINKEGIIIPGKKTESEMKGKFTLESRPEYIMTINLILFSTYSVSGTTLIGNESEHDLVYCRDISELKGLMDEFPDKKEAILDTAIKRGIVRIVDNPEYSHKIQQIEKEMSDIKAVSDDFISVPINTDDEEIFSIKKMFSIQYKDFPEMDVNIQLFPYINDKGFDFAEFMTGIFYEKKGETTLYYTRVHISFSYFDIHIQYLYF